MSAAGEDWTKGPAKWAAVAVLGTASVGGLVWSNIGRVAAGPARDWRVADVTAAAKSNDTKEVRAENGGAETPKADAPVVRDSKPVVTILDINTASAPELELLPDIGPALAQRIIEHREKNGPFKGVDGLDAVRGIGPKTLAKIRPFLTVKQEPGGG